MLILTRNKNQKIIIGNNEITIEVVSINGNQVKLGFSASDDIRINREEIYDKLKPSVKSMRSLQTCGEEVAKEA